jgi:hypothetical protein
MTRQTTNEPLIKWCVCVALCHEQGATIRAMARLFGMSRSTLHRQLPAILSIAASHMGQEDEDFPRESAQPTGPVPAPALSEGDFVTSLVPNGTEPSRA